MTTKHFFTSLTRISDLPQVPFSVEPLSREAWDTGDYVVGEVDAPPNNSSQIELIEKLSGIRALNVLDRRSLPKLRAILKDKLGF